jgi:hypothetical protein
MSWDVALVKIQQSFRPIAEVAQEDYVPLGGLEAVQAAIRSAFPSAEWSNPNLAVYAGPEFEIEFNLDGVERADSVLLHVHGAGDPIPSLLMLTQPHGWLVVDLSTGEFLDPKNPSYEGWEGFRSLVEDSENRSEKE